MDPDDMKKLLTDVFASDSFQQILKDVVTSVVSETLRPQLLPPAVLQPELLPSADHNHTPKPKSKSTPSIAVIRQAHTFLYMQA